MPTPGEPFERLIAQVQARIDPTAAVSHNECLVDRLGQRRQFDVVIRGTFGGRSMLGVIECKDLGRRVGAHEVDAFVTKAQDINANFKLLASRRGFTKPALDKARHYGIGAVSLLDPEVLPPTISPGDWWTAKVYRWNRVTIQARSANPAVPDPDVPPESLEVQGGRVLDWFTNRLLQIGHEDGAVGWVVNFQLQFEPPIELVPRGSAPLACSAIDFHAERECREYEVFVPISAEALFDWHRNEATMPADTKVTMQPVSMDFRNWLPRDPSRQRASVFLPVAIEAHEGQFLPVHSAPNLEAF